MANNQEEKTVEQLITNQEYILAIWKLEEIRVSIKNLKNVLELKEDAYSKNKLDEIYNKL